MFNLVPASKYYMSVRRISTAYLFLRKTQKNILTAKGRFFKNKNSLLAYCSLFTIRGREGRENNKYTANADVNKNIRSIVYAQESWNRSLLARSLPTRKFLKEPNSLCQLSFSAVPSAHFSHKQ